MSGDNPSSHSKVLSPHLDGDGYKKGGCGVQYGPLCLRHHRLLKNLSSVAVSQAGSAGDANVEKPGYHAPMCVVVQDNVTETLSFTLHILCCKPDFAESGP